jgi:sigma-B regulation protein RsbU (phosphoserine phosphatase)
MSRPESASPSVGRNRDRRTTVRASADQEQSNERRQRGIRWIPLFEGCAESRLDELLADCEVLALPAGFALLRLGERNENVFLVLTGMLSVSLQEAPAAVIAIPLGPGECIGELSAIDGKAVSAGVVATLDSRVLKIPKNVFWDGLMALPGLPARVMVILAERMRASNEQFLKAQRESLQLDHLHRELTVARQLQMSMLPLQRPIFPEQANIDICGLMEPAEHIGGDLFDAFFIDDARLFVCIGDVSGHGVAAALFMSRTIGLLRVLAMSENSPAKVLSELNRRLCDGNETNIFVTLFCGILEVATGRLVYSNAGHCAPLLRNRHGVGMLALPRGALAGAIPGMHYQDAEITLQAGDMLLCYTDGVTEAENTAEEIFGETGCRHVVQCNQWATVAELLDQIRAAVANFTAGKVLSDDCTMLALRLNR